MTIPLDLCLTRAQAQVMLGSAIVPDYMDEYIAIALLLMTEKLKGAASKWKPYLDILPKVSNTSLHFTSLHFIHFTSLHFFQGGGRVP